MDDVYERNGITKTEETQDFYVEEPILEPNLFLWQLLHSRGKLSGANVINFGKNSAFIV